MGSVVYLHLKVNPRSSRDRIVGWIGDRLKISVTAPPDRGKANEAVLELLSRTLGIPGSRIRLVAGLSASEKTAALEGVGEDDLFSKLPSRSP